MHERRQTNKNYIVPKGDVKIKGKAVLWKTALRGITQLESHIIMLDK